MPDLSSAGLTAVSDTGDLAAVEEATDGDVRIELGLTGLRRAGGYVDEEFLPALKGRKGVQIYREMGDNDPVIGSLLFAVIQLLRDVDYNVHPAGKLRQYTAAAKFLETNMTDMSHSWDDFIAESCSSLQYGWSWQEVVFKRRGGPWARDGSTRSQYSDNLYGWRKMPIRSQESMQRWVFDDNGEVVGMVQLAPPDYKTRIIPLSRSMLFRYGQHKGNPEGRSMLRNAYRPWFYKKRLEEFESIGVERDLAGLPKVGMPASYLKAKPGTEQFKMAEALRKMVKAVRRNEQEGIAFPLQYDEDTRQPMFTFDLLNSGGARQFSTNEIIQRYEQRILMTCLADFILVGHEQTGTYNMHADKTGIFKTALNSFAKSIADVINRHAVPKLFAVNGWRPDQLPTIVPSDVDAPDLTELGTFLAQTAGIGFPWGPDAEMENYLRAAAGMPELGEEQERSRITLARRTDATRQVETQTAYLQARQLLAQTMAAEQMALRGEPTVEHAQLMAGANAEQAQGEQAQAQQEADQQQSAVEDKRAGQAHEMAMAQGRLSLVGQWAQLAGGQQGPAGGKSGGGNGSKP